MKIKLILTIIALLTGLGAWAQTLTKMTSASELTEGLYIIKDVVTNSAQEGRKGYVYMDASMALRVNTTDRSKDASEILTGSNYSVEYIWRLAKVNDKWTIECANGTGYYFPTLSGNGRITASKTAGQYVITDHASGSGMLSLKCGNTFVNADPGFLAGWSNAHEMELYKIEGTTDELITITYQTAGGETVSAPQVRIPSCKGTTDMTYLYNCPDGYGITSRNGNTVTVMGTLKDGQTYYIASDNRSAQYYLHYNGSGLGLHNGKERSTAYMWTCVRNGNYYTFRNVESGKWLAHKGIANNAYNFTIDPRQKISEGCLPLYSVGESRYMLVKNDGTAFDQATGTYNKNTTNFTSDYVFTECDPMDVMMSESIDNPNWLMISNSRNNSYMLTVKTGDQAGSMLHSSTESTGDGQLFALVGNNQDGFYIYNKMLGNGHTLTAANTNNGTAVTWAAGATTKWYLSTAYLNATANAGYVLSTAKAGFTSLNMHGGAGNDIKFYNSSDDGSRWNLSIVDDTPTIIHYTITGTKKYNDANQWVGKLTISKGSFQSESYITEAQNGTIFNAYLPKSSEAITFKNYNLHGWTFSHEERNGEHYITYTADQETEFQYLGFRPDAQWYRIPAIVSAKNGDLVSIYDYRVCHNDVGFGEVDQVMRRSTNFGQTWTAEQKIADGNGGGKVFGAAFGDPALVADRESSKMTLITVSGTTIYTYANGTDHNLISVQFSEDNGMTWSTPKNITSQFWGAASGMFADADTEEASTTFAYSGFFGSGKILQSRVTKVGNYYRIYAAMLCRGKNMEGAYVVYSDDMGHNWKLLGNDNTLKAATGSDEPKVEELPNGDIVLSCRKYNGRYFNIWHWTTLPTKDEQLGTGSWGTVVDSNTIGTGIKVGGNSCNGEILYVDCQKADGTPAKLMLQSLPSGNDRSGVEIWYKDITDASSYADVTTFASNWTRGLRVSPQSTEDGSFSAYSTMTVQQDGRIGFIFEEGPATYCIVYAPLTLEKITSSAYKANPASVDKICYTLTDANSQTYKGACKGVAGTAPTFTGCEGLEITDGAWDGNNYTANVAFPFPVNTPTYITGEPSGTLCYWWVDGTTIKTNNTLGATNQEGSQAKWEWVITPVINDCAFTFTLKNVSSDKYITGTAAAGTVSVAATGSEYEYKTCMNKKGFAAPGSNVYLSVNSSTAGDRNLILWNKSGSSHRGSDLLFHAPADFQTLMTQLQAALTCPGTEGDGLGEYTLTGLTDQQKTLAQGLVDGTSFGTAAQFADLTGHASYAINKPATGRFYTFKAVQRNKYLANTVNGSGVLLETDNADNAIFYVQAGDAEGQYKLLSYAKGQYASGTGLAAVGSSNYFTLEQAKNGSSVDMPGQYAVVTNGSHRLNMWENGYVRDHGTAYNNWEGWTIAEVTSLPIKMNLADGAYYGTINLPVAVTLPAGLKAYSAVAEGETLNLTKVVEDGVLAANTPVILYSESEITTVAVASEAGTNAETNELEGTIAAEAVAANTNYVLSGKNGVGFYKFSNTTMPGFKAYLPASAANNAREFHFAFGEDITDAIRAIESENSNAEIYNLAGQKVSKAEKGLFIVNGKKVMYK